MTNHRPVEPIDSQSLQQRQRRAIIRWGLSVAGVSCGLGWIANRPLDRGLPWPLRRLLGASDSLWQGLFRSERRNIANRTPAAEPRVNGDIGIIEDIDAAQWRLQLSTANDARTFSISLEQIRSLPVVRTTIEFKCIEGWSQVLMCTGCRFSDLLKLYAIEPLAYAALVSVDGAYYVSIDQQSYNHPQTLLCYAINDQPLTIEQGYPLRLISAVQYGVKSIKQIGSITLSEQKPRDYWAERGYGDYLGH